jgi:hypothetical protein
MIMHSTYGIFDHEADHLIALVHQHVPLAEILSVPCPACGSKISISFTDDGTGFEIICHGAPLHITKYQAIETPPAWWNDCVIEPRDTTWYWRKWRQYDQDGTLRMKISGWTADDVRWSGEFECPVHHPDFEFWRWVFERSGCSKDLIDDMEVEELRSAYKRAKSPSVDAD